MLAEAHLSAIIQSSDDAIISKDLSGTILSWNPAATRIFGFSEAEMIGHSVRRLIPAERQAEEDDILARIARGERVKSFDTMRQRKDGVQIAVSITVSPVYDKAGRIVGASKIARDITSREEGQRALRESEARFRMLADNISQLTWVADRTGAIGWYNKRWYDYTGVPHGSTDGWGWDRVHHPDHLERVREHFAESIAAGREWEDTFPLLGRDGTYRWFLSRAKPIRGEDGGIVYWFGTNTDVTEMLEKEEQIRVLLMEVNHRSKNLLSVVQALARRSGGGDPEFLRRFENRLASLSANQDLLVRRGWSTIMMDELADAQLAILGRDSREQVLTQGLSLALSPRSAEIIGMALHELATNALKYGALSVPTGRVSLSWEETPDGHFQIDWRESGGPAVRDPKQHGFGTTLIRHIPARSLHADVTLDYAPAGLRWQLRCTSATARTLSS
ncbi:signal transduction histidine kinase [Novosphingobium aromaticivorans DSM 12444]|uniref:histidine kinase n=1 Tax=Novosphingobium aromaticivorans (strain ATCC 700278 / DSM 12444 / CCUG 56034 / CIP 105152 / NBRC 16084 / F199) TaxID=279238 RepID=Q2G4X1_NOVAD|nr:PAS domain S-box protein [Novosphingobium aromaticivorans]ABD27102.1 signal transduction histidine kinase [Novosphingobium aromaticivorans DSM 12444]SCY88759.1 signal transduction histidine kinase [Novosphingobium aromaticivorans]